MRSTQKITLGLVPIIAAAAAVTTGCGPSQYTHQRVCVDQSQRVVDDRYCGGAGGGGGYMPYYMPYRSGGYPVGHIASGGSRFAPSSGYVGYGRSAAISRGGFGSTGGGFGGSVGA